MHRQREEKETHRYTCPCQRARVLIDPHSCAQKGSMDNLHRGKALYYNERLLNANTARSHALCMVSNCESIETYVTVRKPADFEHFCSSSVQLIAGWPPSMRGVVGVRRKAAGHVLPHFAALALQGAAGTSSASC